MSRNDPLEPLWQGRALVWALLLALALALVLSLSPGLGQDRLVYFGLAAMVALWIAAATLGGLYALRPRLRGWPLGRVAWLGFGLLMLATWGVGAAAWWLLGPLWTAPDVSLGRTLLSLTGIVGTVGVLSLAGLQNYWRAQSMTARARNAELAALQARIHPHFLFNTLNTAIALVRARPDAAEQVLLDLADLFRVALGAPRQIPLAEELELTRRYLDIEQLRLGTRLAVIWEAPGDLPDVPVPALSLQPLVENAVRHGIEPRVEGGVVEVRCEATDSRLRIVVRNPLPPDAARAAPGHRIGQSAVRARLDEAGPVGARLDTASDGHHYVATLTLPLADQASTR